MIEIYHARQDEVLDEICTRVRGSDESILMATLALNPHLAAEGALLPVGTSVALPERKQETSLPEISLWDE